MPPVPSLAAPLSMAASVPLICPLYALHRSALLSEIKTIIPNFDDFSAQSKLDTLIHGKNVSKSQQVVIAGLFQTYIARTRRFIPSH